MLRITGVILLIDFYVFVTCKGTALSLPELMFYTYCIGLPRD